MFINSSCGSRFTLKLKVTPKIWFLKPYWNFNRPIPDQFQNFFPVTPESRVWTIWTKFCRPMFETFFEIWSFYTYASITFHLPSIIFVILFHFAKQWKFKLVKSLLIGTIQWDFGSLECVRLLYWNYYSRGNFVRGIFCAYQNFEKWPLGGQNADFMLFKLNNRLVNRRLSRNSAFLLYF